MTSKTHSALVVVIAIICALLILVFVGMARGDELKSGIMVTHTPHENEWERFQIDPGFSPSWSRYKTEYAIFHDLDSAFEYVNDGQYANVKMYRIKQIEIEVSRVLVREEVQKIYKNIYKIKEAK